MLFQVISLLTLGLAPLSMAAAFSAGHADVAPSTDGITVSNGSPVKRAACSVGHKKHHGKKPKHHADVPSTDVNPVPPVKDEHGKDVPVKGEPGDGHPVESVAGKDDPIKSEPGDGHPVESVAGSSKFIGLGTSYGKDCGEEKCWQGGACSFTDYHLPKGIDGSTCVSEVIWDHGGHCGGCISVSYKGKTITVMVTNRTDGNATHLDMTPDTMTKLVGYPAGGIPGIEWEFIKCPFAKSSPLTIKVHEGASRYWFAASVENGALRTAKVDVSTDRGQTWMPTTREMYNMYVLGHVLPTDSVWVRATSVTGKEVVVKDVKIESGRSVPASTNYESG